MYRVNTKPIEDNNLRDNGCEAILANTKFISNLEILNISGIITKAALECNITSKSYNIIDENIKYLENLKELDIGSK